MTYQVTPGINVVPRWRLPDRKRRFDLSVVLLTLPIWAPLLALLVAVVFVMQGPGVFFVQPRLGRNGRLFPMIKLRTMTRDAAQQFDAVMGDPLLAQEWALRMKLTTDPRCTPLGRWLRRYSLDELPQVLNVLAGQMSVIGPRPVPLAEFQSHYSGPAAQAYLAMRPGISGMWQVTARNSDYAQRLELDTAYAQSHGLRTDLTILWRTVGAVLRGTGC